MSSPESSLARVAAQQAEEARIARQEHRPVTPEPPKVIVNLSREEQQTAAAEAAGLKPTQEVNSDRKAKQVAAGEKAKLAGLETDRKNKERIHELRFSDPLYVGKMRDVFRKIQDKEPLLEEEHAILKDVEEVLDVAIQAQKDFKERGMYMFNKAKVEAAHKIIERPKVQAPKSEGRADHTRPIRARRTIEGAPSQIAG